MTILDNKNKTDPIAFFDSGVGGLTVMNKVKKILPCENYLYYGDTLHMPYGEKSKEQLLKYSEAIFEFFAQKGAKAVVMACNTTSSVIYEDVKNKYNFKLYPIVQSVSEILSKLPIERIGIFATRATIESGAYQREIFKYNPSMKVFGQHCPDWVHIVEENLLKDKKSIATVKADLDRMLKNNPEKIVLGCTHYPFLADILSEFAPRDMFIDPAVDFAEFIKKDLSNANLLNDTEQTYEEFFVSSNPKQFKIASEMFYKLEKEPNLLIFE